MNEAEIENTPYAAGTASYGLDKYIALRTLEGCVLAL
jgi:hypothetical protein